jgi:glycosyltransferase involved in cell wall biosynthesis
MKISIAMATFNGSKYLQQQLDSFVTQKRQPDELVVCDDCSTDNTLELLQKFQICAPFQVRIYRNETNQGYINSFEKALSFCNGSIIFISDQDDVWLEEKINIVESIFIDSPEVMVIINDSFVSDEYCEKRLYSKLSNVKFNKLSEDAYIAGCATAVRSKFLSLVLPFPQPPICSHDLWINRLAILAGVRVVLARPLQLYRRHDNNVTINSIGANKRVLFPVFSAFEKFGIKDCREGWLKEIAMNKIFIDRLNSKASSIDTLFKHTGKKIDTSIINLNKKNSAIEQRIQLLELGKLRRLFRVLKFLSCGFYSQFQGWKSAIKDVLR